MAGVIASSLIAVSLISMAAAAARWCRRLVGRRRRRLAGTTAA